MENPIKIDVLGGKPTIFHSIFRWLAESLCLNQLRGPKALARGHGKGEAWPCETLGTKLVKDGGFTNTFT